MAGTQLFDEPISSDSIQHAAAKVFHMLKANPNGAAGALAAIYETIVLVDKLGPRIAMKQFEDFMGPTQMQRLREAMAIGPAGNLFLSDLERRMKGGKDGAAEN